LASSLFSATLQADTPEFRLVIKDHKFAPAELTIPAGQKVKLVVENQDPTPEEFESYDFNREKIVPGNGRIVVFVGPLKPGKYEFFGEFNPRTARGWLVAQ
jgi:plastocyanin